MSEDTTEDELGILYTNQADFTKPLDREPSESKPYTSITVEIPPRPVDLENYENNQLVLSNRSPPRIPTLTASVVHENSERAVSDLTTIGNAEKRDSNSVDIPHNILTSERPDNSVHSASMEHTSISSDKIEADNSINVSLSDIHPPLLLMDMDDTQVDIGVQDGISHIDAATDKNHISEVVVVEPIEDIQLPPVADNHNEIPSHENVTNDHLVIEDEMPISHDTEKETVDAASNTYIKYPLRKRTALSLHPYTRFSWTDPETLPNARIDTSVLEEPIEPEDEYSKKGKHDYYDSDGDNDYTDTQTRRFANSLGKDEELGLIPDESELQALLDDTLESNSHNRSSPHHKTNYKRKRRTKSLIVKLALPGYSRSHTLSRPTLSDNQTFPDGDDFSEALARAEEYLQALGQTEHSEAISPSKPKLGRRLMILDDEDEAINTSNQRASGLRTIITDIEEPEDVDSSHQLGRRSKHPSKLTKRNLIGKLPASFLRVYDVDNSTLRDQIPVQSKKTHHLPTTSNSPRSTDQPYDIESERPLSPTSIFSDEMSSSSDHEIRSNIKSDEDSHDRETIKENRHNRERTSLGRSRKQKPINFLDVYELILDEYKDNEVPIFLRVAFRRLLQKYNWGYDISDNPWSKMIYFDPNFIDDDAYQEDQFTLAEWLHGGDFWRRKLRRLRRQRNALKKSQEGRLHFVGSKRPLSEQRQTKNDSTNEITSKENPPVRKRKRPSKNILANTDDPGAELEKTHNESIILIPSEESDPTAGQLTPTISQKKPTLPGKRRQVSKSKAKSKLQQKLDNVTTQELVSTIDACKKLKENGAKRRKVAAFVKAIRKRQANKERLPFTPLDVPRTVASASSESLLRIGNRDSSHNDESRAHSPEITQSSPRPFGEPTRLPHTFGVSRPKPDTNLTFRGRRQRLETIIGKIKRLSLNATPANVPQYYSPQVYQSQMVNHNLPSSARIISSKIPNLPARSPLFASPRTSSILPRTETQTTSTTSNEQCVVTTQNENPAATSRRKRKGIAHRLPRPQSFGEKISTTVTNTSTATTATREPFSDSTIPNEPSTTMQMFHTKLNNWYMQNNTSRFTPKPLISAHWFNRATFLGRGELHTLLRVLDGIHPARSSTNRVFEIFDADIMVTTTVTEFARIIPPFLSQYSDHLCRIWELERSSQKAISPESEMNVLKSISSLQDFVTIFLHDRLPLATAEDKSVIYNVLGTECTYLLNRLDYLVQQEWVSYSSSYFSQKTIGETYLCLICWGICLNLKNNQLENSAYPCFNPGNVSKRLVKYLRKFELHEFRIDPNEQGCSSWGGSIFICLIHILDKFSHYTKSQEDLSESQLTTAPFWSIFNEAILEDLGEIPLDLQDWDFPPLADKGEMIWNLVFALLPLYQFNDSGVYCTQRKCSSNWSLVQYLLEKMSGLLELSERSYVTQFSHRQSRMLDHYVRSLFGRCYELCTTWQWDPDQKVLLLLYRFFEKRQFKDLSSESHPYFPRSLKEFGGIIPREIQFSDTCFHILMRFIYFSLNTWCERAVSFKVSPLQEKSKREVRSFVSRISPTRVLKFTKSQATSDYSPLLNHYNLMLVFALTIPSSIKARSIVQMKSYLNFDESDQMSRKIHIEGFTLLGLIYQHRQENIQPILEVLNERMIQVSQEYLEMESKRITPYVPSIFGERPSDEWLSESDRVKLTQSQANAVELIELIFGQLRRLAAGEDYLPAEFVSTAWSMMLDPALRFPPKIRTTCITHINSLLKIRTELRGAFSKGSVASSSTLDSTNVISGENEGPRKAHESPDDFEMDDFEFDDLDLEQLYFVEQQAVKTENFKTYDQPFATALDKVATIMQELIFGKYTIDLNRTEIDEKYSLHTSTIQKAVECWVDCAAISVEHGLKTWDTYFLSSSPDSWTSLNNATGRKIVSLFFVTKWLTLQQSTTKYLDQIVNVWFQTIVEPSFTVQHIMTSALLNQAIAPRIFFNLPVAINSRHQEHTITKTELTRLRSAVIGAVLSNMGDDYSLNRNSNPEQCAILKRKYHNYLKSMLSSLKDYFEYLNSPALFNEKENYIKLIHDIVGNVIEHCSAIMYQSDSFSTQLPEIRYFMSKDFPLPPADHFYVTQRLRGFSKLNYSADQRLQKSLVEFFQTHLETIFGQSEREKHDEQKLKALVASFLNTSKQSDNTSIWNTTVASFRMFIFGTILKRYITCFIRRSELATLAIPALKLIAMTLNSLSEEYWSLQDPLQGITSLQKEMSILFYPLTNALTHCHTDSHTNSVVHRIISKLVLEIFISCVDIFRQVHIDYRHFYAHNKEWASLLEQTIKIAYLKSVLIVRDILPKNGRQEAFFQDCQDALSMEHINITELSMLAPNRYFSFERQFPSTLMTRQIGECYSTRSMDEVSHELLATIFDFWSQIATFYPHLRATIIRDFSNIKLHHIFKFVEHSRVSNLHFKVFLEGLRPASIPYLVRFWSSHRNQSTNSVCLDLVNI